MNTTTPPGSADDTERAGFLTGIWAAVPTPLLEDGELDLPGIAHNARRLREDLGLQGIFCNGLMGEQWSLKLAERMQILEASIEATNGCLQIGVVASASTLSDTLHLARHAARVGAHHIVLMRPAGLLHEREIKSFIGTVADSCSIPIVLFDGGELTGSFPATLIEDLARDDVIQGVKSTRGDDSAEALRQECGRSVAVMDPYESHWLNNLLRFDLRVLYADPEPYLFQLPGQRLISDYFHAYAQNDLGQAAHLFRTLEPLRALYHRWIMGPLQQGHPINAVLKRWYGVMGFAAGPVRAPLASLSNDEASRFDLELHAAFRQVHGIDFTFPSKDARIWKS